MTAVPSPAATASPGAGDDTELALRRLRAMLANISDTVTLVDPDGRVLDTTGLHASVMGYDPEFWLERSVFDLVDPEEVPRLLAARDVVLARPGEQVTVDVRVVASDGGWADLELTAVNLLEDPAVGGIVITSRNITARKAIEAELAVRRDEAVEQSRLRAEFVARVSHELRNQVHALRGLTELLRAGELPRATRRLADSTHRQAEAFQHLVDDLLEYTRTEADRNRVEPEPTLVRQVLADAASLGSELAADGVEVVATAAEDVPDRVLVDAAKLRRILANLAGNAAKFTGSGRVELQVERCDGRGSRALRWSVRDTGPGIAESDLERIFAPFDQGSHGAQRGGVGLGLAITDRLVTLLGGRISVTSEPGAGSCFVVELPHEVVDDRAEDDRDQHPELDGVRLRTRAHVLVVEDNAVNQMLVAEQLARLGARSTVVGSGVEALAVLGDRHDVDCVLMDWQLPGLDGVETTTVLRSAEPPGRRLPIVGMTASGRPSDRTTCLQAGMDEMLVKPVGLLELGHALFPYIGERRSRPRTTGGAGAHTADTDALDRLAEQLGSVGPVRSIVATFLTELDQRRRAVDDAVRTDDGDLLRRTVHTLRSTSRTLGADELDRLSRELEQAAFPPPADLVASFDRACEGSRRALKAWLADHPADPA